MPRWILECEAGKDELIGSKGRGRLSLGATGFHLHSESCRHPPQAMHRLCQAAKEEEKRLHPVGGESCRHRLDALEGDADYIRVHPRING